VRQEKGRAERREAGEGKGGEGLGGRCGGRGGAARLQPRDPELQLVLGVGAEEHAARRALARVLVLVALGLVGRRGLGGEVAERRRQRPRERLLLLELGGGGAAARAAGRVLRGLLAVEAQLERVERELERAHLRARREERGRVESARGTAALREKGGWAYRGEVA